MGLLSAARQETADIWYMLHMCQYSTPFVLAQRAAMQIVPQYISSNDIPFFSWK